MSGWPTRIEPDVRHSSLSNKRAVWSLRLQDLRADLREADDPTERANLKTAIADTRGWLSQVEAELRDARGVSSPRCEPTSVEVGGQVSSPSRAPSADKVVPAATTPAGRASFRHAPFRGPDDVRRVVRAGTTKLEAANGLSHRQRQAALYILGRMEALGKNEVGVSLRELQNETGMPLSSAQRAVEYLDRDGSWVKKATPRMKQNQAWRVRGKKFGKSPTFFRLSRAVERLAEGVPSAD